MTYTMKQLLKKAEACADAVAAVALVEDESGSNGSEAWQAVQIRVDGRSQLAKNLKEAGVEKDYYWGFVISPSKFNNYFAEEAWCNEFASILNRFDIKARRVERLL